MHLACISSLPIVEKIESSRKEEENISPGVFVVHYLHCNVCTVPYIHVACSADQGIDGTLYSFEQDVAMTTIVDV